MLNCLGRWSELFPERKGEREQFYCLEQNRTFDVKLLRALMSDFSKARHFQLFTKRL